MPTTVRLLTAGASLILLGACASLTGDQTGMSFFVTSVNPGRGGDLGGLAGADQHCQTLAAAVGAGGRSWRAYLSAQPAPGQAGVNARDRIGKGPWRNAAGVVIADDVEQLHGANRLSKLSALTETGSMISGRGDTPNLHDMLTGSQPNGVFIAGDANSTCGNWTMSSGGAAMVGHHDKTGLDDSVPAKSWNSSHQSRGCDLPALRSTGGGGLYYCFAAD
jgi:hypothetical protein